MGNTQRDIIASADELAERCEHYEPDPTDERPLDEYLQEREARRANISDAAHRVINSHADALDRLAE